eukprot:TRINITY_DN27859_c0_g1_i1.p1 TRINITY_DN27859_c0_g1~~TRINITY_DN27859_c0_g1_i1.p1  ORF type:complete len:308 (+),score=61.78 TRINITY_DN27859_c0_g1_i1:35-925(+)
MSESADCWYCGGRDAEACPICAPEKETPLEDESAAVLGQDGWCCPEEPEDVGSRSKWIQTTVEEYNLRILCESEAELCNENYQVALDLTERCCRNLEKHLDAAQPQGILPSTGRRGEHELFCLSMAHRARCLVPLQYFSRVIDDCKRFGRLYDGILDAGRPALLHEQETKVLACRRLRSCDSESRSRISFIGHMALLGAAVEIAQQSRERVGNGFAPKTVLDHSMKAIEGLRPLDMFAFPGLNSLRAHLYISRAQANLELERWDDAKKDANLALTWDPAAQKAANYLLDSALNQEW